MFQLPDIGFGAILTSRGFYISLGGGGPHAREVGKAPTYTPPYGVIRIIIRSMGGEYEGEEEASIFTPTALHSKEL